MAYQTGSATDLADLLDKLNTFAVANGWTLDEFDTVNGDWAISKNDIFVSGRWNVATPLHLSLHQALAFDGASTLPGDHTDDSGHGYNATSSHVNTLLDDERHVSDIGDGPFPSYHFFEHNAGPAYIHVVVQSEAGIYKHFGFGELSKVGDWTGGEYCYGYYQSTGTSQTAVSNNSVMLFDGINNGNMVNIGQRNATMHVEGLPGMGASDKWGAIVGSLSIAGLSSDLDGNGNPLTHMLGGFRGGPVARWWGQLTEGSNSIGFVPMYPINVWHYQSSNARVRLLGHMPDVRGISLRNFSDEEEVVIGGDTWVLFPSARRTPDNIPHRTYHQGIAYKKVTA